MTLRFLNLCNSIFFPMMSENVLVFPFPWGAQPSLPTLYIAFIEIRGLSSLLLLGVNLSGILK